MRPVDEALRLRVGTPHARWVLVHLCTFADNETGICWPSVPTLAEGTGLAERTVRRAVVELEEMGLVQVARGKGRSGNRYTVLHVAYAVPVAVLVARNAAVESAFEPVDNEKNAAKRDGNAATQSAECGPTGRRTYSRTDLELAAAVPLGDFDAVRAQLGIGKHRRRVKSPAA